MDPKIFKRMRLRKKMSQVHFAEFLGVSQSTVAAIETGRRGISDTVRARLAEKIAFDEGLLSFLDSYEKVNSITQYKL